MANNIIKGRNINYYSLFIPTNNDDGGGEGTAVVRKSLLSRVRVEVQFACRVKAHFACRGVEITTDEVVHTRSLEHANARRSVLQAARTPKMNYNRPRLRMGRTWAWQHEYIQSETELHRRCRSLLSNI